MIPNIVADGGDWVLLKLEAHKFFHILSSCLDTIENSKSELRVVKIEGYFGFKL